MSQDDPLVRRIERQAAVPGLLGALAERLPGSDLQSLLLETFRRRAARVRPGHLLRQYERDRFVGPASVDPRLMLELDGLAFSLLPNGYSPIDLAPVCPLGTTSAVSTVDQNSVVATARNTEVQADATSSLALECAARRRVLLRGDRRSTERVRLASSHRVLRAQRFAGPGMRQHFRLFGMVVAGRDEGAFRFEIDSLREHLAFYVRLLQAVGGRGGPVRNIEVTVTDLDEGRRSAALESEVLTPLAAAFAGVRCLLDPARTAGRGYYTNACFGVSAADSTGARVSLVDGGFTTWTRQLLSNAKERLLISGLGTERLCERFIVS